MRAYHITINSLSIENFKTFSPEVHLLIVITYTQFEKEFPYRWVLVSVLLYHLIALIMSSKHFTETPTEHSRYFTRSGASQVLKGLKRCTDHTSLPTATKLSLIYDPHPWDIKQIASRFETLFQINNIWVHTFQTWRGRVQIGKQTFVNKISIEITWSSFIPMMFGL